MGSLGDVRFDVVGVGALNVDVVVDVSGAGWALRDDEAAVGAGEMARLLGRAAPLPRRIVLGGSAFNTVAALARRQSLSRLGFVGVEGEVPFGATSFREHLRGLGVDVAALGTAPGHAGICLALEDRGVRSLRIAPGANVSMADHVAAVDVAEYLARARVVHLTSFLDERTPETLADLLADLRKRPTRPLVCLDPGHDWCVRPDAAVRSLVGMADLVLVNERELADLGNAVDLERVTVVVKRPGHAVIHRDGAAQRVDGGPPLRTDEIKHPTGAGDAFAAGLLAALTGNTQKAGTRGARGLPSDLAEPVRSGLVAARTHLLEGRDQGLAGAGPVPLIKGLTKG
ncbi:carbohydrate kinase family protein [Yinghuangia soli]|uniref:Carbohydrate kinase family protein n=1 Tax=Yinghuangia soli TaxID=2908204 RepID=A0AA41U4K4_9ACTN|nr:carbohydrate kinase family protein [Yinghuangia soli]MCF2530897.1 carbohydrate kinase family protein [Yinghuangia soli]